MAGDNIGIRGKSGLHPAGGYAEPLPYLQRTGHRIPKPSGIENEPKSVQLGLHPNILTSPGTGSIISIMNDRMQSSTKLSIIMPVYNEKATLEEIISRVEELPLDKEIIIVDDGSTDGSAEILRDLPPGRARVILQEANRGKGAAIRAGIPVVTGDVVVIQDADLEYDPGDLLKLLKPIVEGKADVVYGSRFTGERKNMFFWHWIGNRFLTLVTNILFDTTLSDMETCYKMFKADIIKGIDLRSNRFEIEVEMTAKVLRKKHRIYEVPISYAGREFREGKKITWRDGLTALWNLFRFRFFD
jgi:glycosyltransferase involved in cell wall biosynthesis